MIEPKIFFGNQHIKRFPPPRLYYPVEFSGISSKGVEYKVSLLPISMDRMRKDLEGRAFDRPVIQGNWDLMRIWIDNMWDALYNPLELWLKPDGKLGIIKGHHRFRLLDAMDANQFWAYVLEASGYKIGERDPPPAIKETILKNELPPRKGTRSGVCEHCGQETRWRMKTIVRGKNVRMICLKCGKENPYPWNGEL